MDSLVMSHSGKFWLFSVKIEQLLIGMSDFSEIFFKMQVISVAFRLVRIGIRELETELLGMLERAVIGYSSIYFLENN
jgi:hypothetical protein